ncbi:MAG: ectonucleotide pyrophosphatase/phosphodiesterase [Alphaproteobacteria bacterium]|uniref:alkaline phosphatase family protein n=1 Tax=Brevundimonas sp. TaxID=1871086 RepID=UPI001A1A2822|nr:ectonucleotide pyrophosphatase/phosphodiesterase [Brevundimonas sp.]MBU1271152.1 ectonucleotide pyrophosphatase/phosphodiesterase [Alphaproteobacteria bacterium]MBJ7320555.1 alkaline phosphatase family protein [Brevundimonas sp.]MBU1521660.1 ectonucleotide pyrophosphatase/phosphodiesterase [Alphaproteobacteria bacterium]MBU2031040.1 ectonucleotide pyrophosphatase/phosphodiesterase [Alphaproteobacteria bacterium]MBU2163045.1 ectonucleotide pyrophosphatase/phosphodiesterase [Alphaproteobacter
MSRFLVSGLALVAALAVASCAGAPASTAPVTQSPVVSAVATQADRPDPVILISIDGFRPDYLGRGATPVMDGLVAGGAFGPMRPSFPSVTFPNHYTLVTGLHPDHHGIVGNRFTDAELGVFTMASKESGFWDQAEPIWVSAEKAGVRTGTMFWPGSEVEIHGVRPSRWEPFDQSMSGDARVDRILSWLDLPADQRPRFETLYFDIVDSAGHRHGPDAAETRAAVASVDASIGRLVEGLKARGLYDRTLLVLVSDHGMAATSPDRVVWIDDIIDPAALQIGYGGAVLTADPAPGREAEVQQKLVGRHPHMECWNKADVPARLVYGSNPRVARIVCLVETGWLTATRDRPVTRPGGAHGYDNQAPEMQALFIAHGPGVIPGRRLTDLDSVDVQPFLARVLGVTAPQGDGRAEDTLPVTTQ